MKSRYALFLGMASRSDSCVGDGYHMLQLMIFNYLVIDVDQDHKRREFPQADDPANSGSRLF